MDEQEFRVTITSVKDVWEYVVWTNDEMHARYEALALAREDGMVTYHTVEAAAL